MRIHVDYPWLQPCSDTTPISYRNALLQSIRRAADQPIRMVVIVLSDGNKTRYDLLKLWLAEMGIPSQCVQLSTLRGHPRDGGRSRNFTSIIVNMVLQMICKMDGALWKVEITVKRAMFVGYDLYHDSTLQGKTIGACVLTFDKDYTMFYSQALPHDEALYKYYINNNRTLPQRIFLYCAGVDDGQIPLVEEKEVLLVQQTYIEMTKYFGWDPELYSQDPDTFLRNRSPGTVINSVVTLLTKYDFYLVPEHVNRGTVIPVCYSVIYDDTGLLPDQHHRIAFKLSHLYYNWPGTIMVPAPCEYACKLAFMVAQSNQRNVTEELRDKFFL